VAVHAALTDPVRLSIMDLLRVADASPSEPAARPSVPSNLMAHHLRVLDDAGLIRRSRSTGDRRRTYLSTVSTPLEPVDEATERTAPRVVFVPALVDRRTRRHRRGPRPSRRRPDRTRPPCRTDRRIPRTPPPRRTRHTGPARAVGVIQP
jgi:hypothetical protein